MHEQLNRVNSSSIAYRLEGETVDLETGFGIADLRVDLVDYDGLCTDLVAHAKTDRYGHFSIVLDSDYLDSLFFGRIPTLAFRVYIYGIGVSEVREKFTDPAETWTPSATPARIRIALDMDEDRTVASPAKSIVRGRLMDAQGNPCENFTVNAYDKGLTEDTLLGSNTTDGNGWFYIDYGPGEIGREDKIHADLVVRAFAPEDEEEETPIAQVGEMCSAPTTATIHLIKGDTAYRGPSEDNRVGSAIASVIGETVPMAELTEDQVSYVACTTNTDREFIATFVQAAQLGDEMDIEPAAVYALLRQKLPSTSRGILAQRPAEIRQAIERSMVENIIPGGAAEEIDGIVDMFTAKSVELALDEREGGGTGLGDVIAIALTVTADREIFVEQFIEHEGTVEEFWTALAANTAFTASSEIPRLKRLLQWGALTRYHAPLVAYLESLWENEEPDELTSVRDVVRYDEDGWKTILDTEVESVAIGCPPDTPGSTEEARRTNFAKILERSVETAFPTAVIAARITAEDEENDEGVITFFADNPQFEFATTRIATYLAANTSAMSGIDAEDRPEAVRRLKAIERIFRITRRYPEMKILRDAGLHSAQSIHRLGSARFVREYGSDLGVESAKRIFGRACWIASTATALYSKYGAQLHSLPIFALPDLVTPADDPPAVVADWATLFGSADACACEHCRSVYGPAAYLVDLLDFLSKFETPTGNPETPTYVNARRALIGPIGDESTTPKGRRPDIARILLSCENTSTTLPYIDLVNEILEVAVANVVDDPDHLWPEELSSNKAAAELLAEPEIVFATARNVAYSELASAVHPFNLPFHFWEVEARLYLEHLGAPRHSLLETFFLRKKVPPTDIADQIARERLRLSERAWDVLRGEAISGVDPNDYWGVPAGENWEDALALVPAFLQQSGLSFEELRELLATAYVVTEPSIGLDPAEGCDIDAKSLTNLSDTVLGRIHRFLRLRKHVGVSITEADWITTAFGVTDIDDELLRHVAETLALQKDLNVPLAVALSFWGPMGKRSNEWKTSLYEQIFLTKAISQLSDQFALLLTTTSSDTIMQHAIAVMLALRIKLEELGVIMVPDVADAIMGLPQTLAVDAVLSVENLSRLHRIVAFSRALRLSISEFLILRALSGMNVLTGDDTNDATPAETRAFVALLNKLRGAGLKVADVHYLVRHVEAPSVKVGIADDVVERIVGEIETQANQIKADVEASEEPEGEQPALIEARVETMVAQKLAAEMKVDVAIVEHLLSHAITAFGESTDSAMTDFYPESGTSAADRGRILVRLYKAIMLVKWLKFDVMQLQWLYPAEAESNWLELDSLPYERDNTANDYRARFADLVRLVEFAAVRDELPDGAEGLLSILQMAKEVINSTATDDDFYDEIVARTGLGFTRSDIEALSDTHFGYQINPLSPAVSDFLDERALGNVLRALKTLHSVGASVTEGIAWADLDIALPVTTEPEPATSFDIKRKARAKHDDAQWPNVARPIRDALREMQRDALVGYLISADDDIDQPNDLFAKLLIDVEMSPCQLTSRIKQAISSVQTFVQRSFLGLESDVKLGEDAAREWEWLKNYRVWEANRKVFLYPENWIEPELRDDKTPFFETLESSLNQGDIDGQSTERIYMGYLDELHGIGRLDIAAVCHQQEDEGNCKRMDVVHVIGRTHAQPRRYYYRRRIDGSYWTPWEKIDLEIQGDHLLATVWNRRLYLIWPMFEERTDNGQIKDQPVQKNWRVTLSWSAYETDGFGPMRTSKAFFNIHPLIPTKWISFLVAKAGNDLLVSCLVNWYGIMDKEPSAMRWSVIAGVFAFQPCLGEWKTIYNAPPLWDPEGKQNLIVWTPARSTPEYMRLGEVAPPESAEEPAPPPPPDPLRFPRANGTLIDLLDKTPGLYSLLMDRTVENVTFAEAPRDVFFYTDTTRAFFMDKRSRLVIPWIDEANAHPNMPVKIGQPLESGLEPVVLEWANKPLLDMNVDFTVDQVYRFQTFYHPYVCEFTRRLARDGINGLLRWSSAPEIAVQNLSKTDVDTDYEPTQYVYDPFPIENVDFSFGGAYSQYNWELFFHAPFMFATRLTKDGRFEDADRWYRYIFDPAGGAPGDGPERFWNVRPFRENISLASIQAQLEELSADNPQAQELEALLGLGFDSDGATGIAAQIARWRETPFNPHLIARMRLVAYQKAVVMKYVANLLAWGDSLFRRDTMESINEATQLYVLASQILGPRPRLVKTNDVDPKTYAQLESDIDAASSVLVEIESIVPEPRDSNVCCTGGQPAPTWYTSYFCVPHNEKMLALWDTVEDRLLKVRCCMNIDGVVRQLPLFEAPLDPGLFVKATAAGLDLGEVLADVYIPLPNYRFSVLLPKAVEFAGSVAAMGNALLSALEKRDGEALSKLRSTQEIDMLTRVRSVRKRQIDEARETLEGLRKSRAVIGERLRFYTEIENRISEERAQKTLSKEAMVLTGAAQGSQLAASVLKLMPQLAVGTASFAEFGGVQLAGILEVTGLAFSLEASHRGAKASMAGTEAGYKRRDADWGLQKKLAELELTQIDRQIAAAEIRLEIAQTELQNHDQSLKNAKEVDDYLRTKYTREELYEWLITQVKGIYFQAYKVAYDLAKRAQKAFQFELALPDETFLVAAYWDKTTDGLLAGERLQHDLRRMEATYLEQNKREYEITKHVSLAEVKPTELLKLRETGTCNVELPEAVFDLDWPGHYLRRIKSVSMSIPVVNAPYAGVNCKLTLEKNFVRKSGVSGGTYPRAGDTDPQFVSYQVPMQSIITSSAQQDGGLFELVFRDERYLPFEGAGADSTWAIKLDSKTNRFNPTDAKDVILHIRYTARESDDLKETVETAWTTSGPSGYRLFSAKADFPGEWAAFTTGAGDPLEHRLALPFSLKHFQPILGSHSLEITSIQLFAKRSNGGDTSLPVELKSPGVEFESEFTSNHTLATSSEFGSLLLVGSDTSASEDILPESNDEPAPWNLRVQTADKDLEDIWIVCTYQQA